MGKFMFFNCLVKQGFVIAFLRWKSRDFSVWNESLVFMLCVFPKRTTCRRHSFWQSLRMWVLSSVVKSLQLIWPTASNLWQTTSETHSVLHVALTLSDNIQQNNGPSYTACFPNPKNEESETLVLVMKSQRIQNLVLLLLVCRRNSAVRTLVHSPSMLVLLWADRTYWEVNLQPSVICFTLLHVYKDKLSNLIGKRFCHVNQVIVRLSELQ